MAVAQGYRNDFISPTDGQRSLIIWQWMDGLVSKEAITKDLEAFKAAGLSGVQNFQIGGDLVTPPALSVQRNGSL